MENIELAMLLFILVVYVVLVIYLHVAVRSSDHSKPENMIGASTFTKIFLVCLILSLVVEMWEPPKLP